jgi:hypothetical protein
MNTLALHLTLALGLTLLQPFSTPATLANGVPLQLRVSVFNYAGLSTSTIQQAEDVTTRIFLDAGIRVIWLNCPQDSEDEDSSDRCAEASFPAHMQLRILRSVHGLKPSVVGISFMSADGIGCSADVFYEPLQVLQRQNHVVPSVILGHAMAHELGHLLLGTNSHSPTGIMRAHWTSGDLASATVGHFVFTLEQSRKIRMNLRVAEGFHQ